MKAEKYEIMPNALWCLLQMMQVNEAGQQYKNNMYWLSASAETTKSDWNR